MSIEPFEFEVFIADWQEDATRIRAIRTCVFIHEQKVPEQLEWDEHDAVCLHLLAITDSGKAIGTARLLDSGQIGRMAVLQPFRRAGVGKAMLRMLLDVAGRKQMKSVFLNSQSHATKFYQSFGFTETGEQFDEADIPHCRMIKSLPGD